MELNVAIDRCLESISFGTSDEEIGLWRLGKLLAVPEKGLRDFEHHESCRYDHWEIYACNLAAAIACSYVYRNQYRFLWENFSQEKNFAKVLLKLLRKNKAVTKDGKIGERFFEFLATLQEPASFSLSVPYWIRIGYHYSRIRRMPDWGMIYNGREGFEDIKNFPRAVHPLVYVYIQRFLKCRPHESACIVQVMIDGLRKCAGET